MSVGITLPNAATPEELENYVLRIKSEEQDKQRDLALRRGYLQIIDAIERRWGISPTTAELRKQSPA